MSHRVGTLSTLSPGVPTSPDSGKSPQLKRSKLAQNCGKTEVLHPQPSYGICWSHEIETLPTKRSFCPSPLPFGGSTVLSLTCGPAGNPTTTGTLSATQECRDTNCTTRTTNLPTKRSTANANTEKTSRQQCRSGISTSPTLCCDCDTNTQTIPQQGALARLAICRRG